MEVRLRPIAPSDMDKIYEIQADDESIRMAAFTAADPKNRDYFDQHWAKILSSNINKMVAVEADGEVVGSVGSYDRDGEREVTYSIDREHWGRGLATRALQLYLETHEHTRPVFGTAAADNIGSMRVLEKCGFQRCGSDMGFANARGCEIEEIFFRLD